VSSPALSAGCRAWSRKSGNRFSDKTMRKIGKTRMPEVENNRVVETATEARAGTTGHNVRYVLIIGTLAVIVLFAVAYYAT